MSDDDAEITEQKQIKGSLEPLLNMRLPASICLISKSFSGKSTLLNSLLYHLAKKGRLHDAPTQIIVFAGSSDVDTEYTSILPRENVRRGWNEQIASRILALHKKKIDLLRRQSERARAPVKVSHIIFVLEDIIGCSNVNTSTSKVLQFLFTQGRHYYVSVIVSSQSATVALSPTIRLNASAIVWSVLSQDHLKHIWRATTGMTWQEFLAFSSKLKQYEFGFYDNIGNTGIHTVKAADFPQGKWYLKNKEKNKNDKRKKKNKE